MQGSISGFSVAARETKETSYIRLTVPKLHMGQRNMPPCRLQRDPPFLGSNERHVAAMEPWGCYGGIGDSDVHGHQ